MHVGVCIEGSTSRQNSAGYFHASPQNYTVWFIRGVSAGQYPTPWCLINLLSICRCQCLLPVQVLKRQPSPVGLYSLECVPHPLGLDPLYGPQDRWR